MELGRHLVRELRLKDRGDTLGLWMAQHIADLIKTAEKEKSAVKRKRAQKEATETILKIWEHRESLPSYAYPLARYEDLFKVLDRLLPSENPFRSDQDVGRTDLLAASLFHDLSHLIICLLLMKPLSLDTAAPVDEAVLAALSEDERHVWGSLQKWFEIFLPKKTDSSQHPEVKEPQPERVDIDWKEIALDLVTRIKGSSEELQVELSKPDLVSTGSAPRKKKASATSGRKRRTKK